MKELDSYLNDHLAGSVSALEVTAHWTHAQKGAPLGGFFGQIEAEIKADQDRLRDVMCCLGVGESKVRKASAWAAEKVGRARLMIAGDEPGGLGLVLTLEGLIIGVRGKELLWRALATLNLPELKDFDFGELQNRAQQQMERMDAERLRAAQRVLMKAPR
jgi:hypothetical protein